MFVAGWLSVQWLLVSQCAFKTVSSNSTNEAVDVLPEVDIEPASAGEESLHIDSLLQTLAAMVIISYS